MLHAHILHIPFLNHIRIERIKCCLKLSLSGGGWMMTGQWRWWWRRRGTKADMNGIDIDLSESLNSSPGTETGEEQEEDGPLSVQYALLLNRNCFDEIYSPLFFSTHYPSNTPIPNH